MGWAHSPEGPEYWTTMRDGFSTILAEDLRLFSSIQRGVENGSVSDIMLGYKERTLYWMEEEIDRLIGPENIPSSMAVAQVLGGHVETA